MLIHHNGRLEKKNCPKDWFKDFQGGVHFSTTGQRGTSFSRSLIAKQRTQHTTESLLYASGGSRNIFLLTLTSKHRLLTHQKEFMADFHVRLFIVSFSLQRGQESDNQGRKLCKIWIYGLQERCPVLLWPTFWRPLCSEDIFITVYLYGGCPPWFSLDAARMTFQHLFLHPHGWPEWWNSARLEASADTRPAWRSFALFCNWIAMNSEHKILRHCDAWIFDTHRTDVTKLATLTEDFPNPRRHEANYFRDSSQWAFWSRGSEHVLALNAPISRRPILHQMNEKLRDNSDSTIMRQTDLLCRVQTGRCAT